MFDEIGLLTNCLNTIQRESEEQMRRLEEEKANLLNQMKSDLEARITALLAAKEKESV